MLIYLKVGGGNKLETKKCIVWDLDNTLWNGVLLEGDEIILNESIKNTIIELDKRGIINSIASKNEEKRAMDVLKQLNINEYFVLPQINQNIKSNSIHRIAKALNLNLNSFAFVDDQDYELEEIRYELPQVLCINARDADKILDMPEFNPDVITESASKRRQMYQDDILRTSYEEEYEGPKEEFLKSLNMVLRIRKAELSDLKRIEELTIRTHQLNTTGYTFSHEELCSFLSDPHYMLLIADMNDKFGDYGEIGVTLIHCANNIWTIKLFLMSCRVMSRGIGQVFIANIIHRAKDAGVKLCAEYKKTDVNRIMLVTYRFNGFDIKQEIGENSLLEYDNNFKQNVITHIKIISEN